MSASNTASPETAATEQVDVAQETPTTPTNQLYVGNIPYDSTAEELQQFFQDYEVQEVKIPMVKRYGKNKTAAPRPMGYAFVTFSPSVRDLDAIVNKFADAEFKGRKIYVMHPKPREEKKKPEEPVKSEETKAESEKTEKKKKAKKPKQKKEKIPFDQGVKSTDTLYIKNLDFGVKSKDLKEFFVEEGEAPEWVSVPFVTLPGFVVKKLREEGKDPQRRNRGYAFVKFNLAEGETIEDKVEKFSGKVFRDREIVASVAVDVRDVENGEENKKTAPTEEEETKEEAAPAEEEQ